MSTAPIILVSATSRVDGNAPRRVRVNDAYVRSLEGAGLVPLVVPPLGDTAAVERALDVADGLLLTGGEDVDPAAYGEHPHPALGDTNPERDATEIALMRAAQARKLPTLAICRGIQVANVALGGTLIQDIPSQRPDAGPHTHDDARASRVHEVHVDAGTRLASVMNASTISVNSIHHQSINRIADALKISATAPDGIVEGAESVDESWWMLAVQWHPEDLTHTRESWDRGLFKAFADAVRAHVAEREQSASLAGD